MTREGKFQNLKNYMGDGSHLDDVLGGEGVGGQAVQVLGVGHEDGGNVSFPLLPFMASRFILKMGHFHGP